MSDPGPPDIDIEPDPDQARSDSGDHDASGDHNARGDRIAFRAALGGLLLCAWTAGLFVVADGLDPDLRLILGYPTLLIWLFPGTIGHLGLLIYAILRASRGAAMRMLPLFLYLLLVAGGAVAVAVESGYSGAIGEFGHELATFVQRRLFDSAQLDLEDAVFRRDVEDARDALAAGADPDGMDPNIGMPLVSRGLTNGGIELLDLLLDAGADPNQPMARALDTGSLLRTNRVPLDWAAEKTARDRAVLVQRLLDAGAAVGLSALLPIACQQGDLALYEMAIRGGAREVDEKGRRCLHYAGERGALDIATAHLRRETDLGALNASRQSALDVALQYGHLEVALLYAEAGVPLFQPSRARKVLALPDGDPAIDRLKAFLLEQPGVDQDP